MEMAEAKTKPPEGGFLPAVSLILSTSEVELQCKLNGARICRGKNLSECSALQTCVRIAEFRMVKDIEEFRPESQL